MAVLYFRFKCVKDFRSMPIPGNYISVGELKDLIFETKLSKGRDFDLVITNAQTNEDYLDEFNLIPANTSVLIRRLPGWPRKPIVVAPVAAEEEPNFKEEHDSARDTLKPAVSILDSEEWDEFFSSNSLSTSSTLTAVDDDEDSKIKALVDKPTLDSCGGGGMGRRMTGRNIPPEGYVCHRCKVAGHFIQHCPTNGDPDYDVKKIRAPRGVPRSMLIATQDGSYGLSNGKVADLMPDEAAFEKAIVGMPTVQRSMVDTPPELYCTLCNKLMEYAMITSKCCLESFCDQCIRNFLISNSMCVCGATNILADHLLPNLTLRNTINRILEFNDGDVKNNKANVLKTGYLELHNPESRVSSPGQSVASNKEAKVSGHSMTSNKEAKVSGHSMASNKEAKVPSPGQPVNLKKREATADSKKQDTFTRLEADAAEDEESETSKKRRKRAHVPLDSEEMQWPTAQNLTAEDYVKSMALPAYIPYRAAPIQPRTGGFFTPGRYAGAFPGMNVGVGPLDILFGAS